MTSLVIERIPSGRITMDRSVQSRDTLLVSPRALRWFFLESIVGFAVLTLSVRDERFSE